jgi:hypothetical protein
MKDRREMMNDDDRADFKRSGRINNGWDIKEGKGCMNQ